MCALYQVLQNSSGGVSPAAYIVGVTSIVGREVVLGEEFEDGRGHSLCGVSTMGGTYTPEVVNIVSREAV